MFFVSNPLSVAALTGDSEILMVIGSFKAVKNHAIAVAEGLLDTCIDCITVAYQSIKNIV